jgi:TonB family protein
MRSTALSAAMLLALLAGACSSAPRSRGSSIWHEDSAQQAADGKSTPPAVPASCAFPEGKQVLVIENRLNATRIVKPEYPHEAKEHRIEGTVEVSALVDESGDVVWACAKGEPTLARAAENAAFKCKFPKYFGAAKPWVSGSTPVVMNFDFRLNDAR